MLQLWCINLLNAGRVSFERSRTIEKGIAPSEW